MSLGQYWYPTGPFWRLCELSLESSPKCAWQIFKGSLHANFMTLNNIKLFASSDYPCFVIVPISFCCCISAAKLCPTLWKPVDCSFQGSSVLHYRLELAQIHVQRVSDAKYLIFCYPLLLLPSIFHSIRVFSSESTLCIRWPNNWNFSINPCKEYSGLI